MAKTPRPPAPLPSKQELLDFIENSPTPVGKREIARAFHIRGADRVALKALLREIDSDGKLTVHRGRRISPPGALPEVTVLEIVGPDRDGDLMARPADTPPGAPTARIHVAERGQDRGPALGPGDRVLARLKRLADGGYEARVMKRLAAAPQRVLAVFTKTENGARLVPVDRRDRQELNVPPGLEGPARPGDLVLARALPGRRLGLRDGEVIESLGTTNDPRAATLIALHRNDIPTEFAPKALTQARAAKPAPLDKRTDLRAIPLVTIDDADARDFDDAVWAEADRDPNNPGGWHLRVAIADVAWYVRPGDALDRTAYERGNSVYFPDRVVPMLPEELSNELCSLKPGENRPCMFVEMWIDGEGRKLRHFFGRGLMKSAARLTYIQVQTAADGHPDDAATPLVETVIKPLYGAYGALQHARTRRGTLELDLPERKVVLNEDGTIAGIQQRQRHDSHRLIEEFMIAANVCAAETLEHRRQPCMYRVHDEPAPAKIEALRDFLDSLGQTLARGQRLRPGDFTSILQRVENTPHAPAVNEAILRSQSQAVYSPDNLGHFGLALERYGHFTSPIRRYADLLVHRALISGLDLGAGGLPADAEESFVAIGEHISLTERRAAIAERDAVDRYTAAFLADRVGAIFAGRISGVTRFGLFVKLSETGADGLVPISTLPDDYYNHDEKRHSLVGRRSGRVYRMGDEVEVKLAEANALTGGMILEMSGSGARGATKRASKPAARSPRRGSAGKGASTRRRRS